MALSLPTRPRFGVVFVVWCINSGYKDLQERIKNKPVDWGWENG
jgi:hypothetical protein